MGTAAVRRVSFLVVLVLASLLLLLALAGTFPLLLKNWLPAEAWLRARPDRSTGDQVHRLHSLALALISWGILSGVLLQLHRPRRKVGALLMAAAGVVAVALGEMVVGTFTAAGVGPFLVIVLLVGALHPSARTVLRPSGVDLPMLALALVALGPAIPYAADVGAGAPLASPEWEVDHLSFMVGVALVIPLWALVGSLEKPGWGFPAGAAVGVGGCVALQSLIFPDALSGLGAAWAWAVLAWCVAYAGAAWLRRRRGSPGVAPDPPRREAAAV
jgi:hypothetical protein